MKKKTVYVIRAFSMPSELVRWLSSEAKRDGISSVSSFLSMIVKKEKTIRARRAKRSIS